MKGCLVCVGGADTEKNFRPGRAVDDEVGEWRRRPYADVAGGGEEDCGCRKQSGGAVVVRELPRGAGDAGDCARAVSLQKPCERCRARPAVCDSEGVSESESADSG